MAILRDKRLQIGSLPGPIGWLLAMADTEIPSRLSHAFRLAVCWIALPFILLLVGVEKIFDPSGSSFQIGACFVGVLLSICIAVYWERIIPLKFRSSALSDRSLSYLSNRDSELGPAIIQMARKSAWGKWFAAQNLLNSERPIDMLSLLNVASHDVMGKILDGALEVQGRSPRQTGYAAIPRTDWRSSALMFIQDQITLWKMRVVPTGGVTIDSDGMIEATDAEAHWRNAALANYDSLIVDAYQFESLWPLKDAVADKQRRQFLKNARRRKLDKDEIRRLS